MGIDVIMLAERRMPSGTWERAEPLVEDPHARVAHTSLEWDPKLFTEAWEDAASGVWRERFYLSRARTLHDALSFGSCLPASATPIAPNRGLPSDITPSVRAAADWFTSAFGHSWATVAEVAAFDWGQPLVGCPTGPDGPRTFHEAAYHFVDDSLPLLLSYGPPEHVRIVFWFD